MVVLTVVTVPRPVRVGSASTFSSSSDSKSSVVSVGPNRSPTAPLYFSRTSRSTFRRNFASYARCDGRPALRCFSPAAPSSRYSFHSRFACR